MAIEHSCIAKRLADLCYLVRHLRCTKQALSVFRACAPVRTACQQIYKNKGCTFTTRRSSFLFLLVPCTVQEPDVRTRTSACAVAAACVMHDALRARTGGLLACTH